MRMRIMVFEIQLTKESLIGSRRNILQRLLAGFTRDELRRIAVWVGVPRGRDKSDTINNLALSDSFFRNASVFFGIEV